MANTTNNIPGSQDPQGPTHDDREIHSRGIGIFTGSLAVAVAIAMVAMWGLKGFLTDATMAGYDEPLPVAAERPTSPPDPKLQPRPRLALTELRETEERELTTYGWVDRSSNVVRIPIERAIAILAEGGLPNRSTPAPASDPAAVPNDSSLTPPPVEAPSGLAAKEIDG